MTVAPASSNAGTSGAPAPFGRALKTSSVSAAIATGSSGKSSAVAIRDRCGCTAPSAEPAELAAPR